MIFKNSLPAGERCPAEEILSAQDYYPYGGIVNGRSFDNSDNLNKFKFTEKERDAETNLDYAACPGAVSRESKVL